MADRSLVAYRFDACGDVDAALMRYRLAELAEQDLLESGLSTLVGSVIHAIEHPDVASYRHHREHRAVCRDTEIRKTTGRDHQCG